MARDPKPTLEELIVKEIVDGDMALAKEMAKLMPRPAGTRPLSSEEELAKWDQRALSVEDEQRLWGQGKSPQEIAEAVFPWRRRLVEGDGRAFDYKAQVSYAKRMAKRSNERERQQISDVSGMFTEIGAPDLAAQVGGTARTYDGNAGEGFMEPTYQPEPPEPEPMLEQAVPMASGDEGTYRDLMA